MIDIDESKSLIVDSCIISSNALTNGFWLLNSGNNALILNSIFFNNTVTKTKRNQEFSLIKIDSNFNIESCLFKFNFMKNTTMILVNNFMGNEKLVNIYNLIFEYNTELSQETSLNMNIYCENIEILMKNITLLNNYAPGSLISILNSQKSIEINDLKIISSIGFELLKLDSLREISFSFFYCLKNNNLTNLSFDELNYGNCLSITDYLFFNITNSIFSNNYAESSLTGILLEHTSNFILLIENNDNSAAFAYMDKIKFSSNVVDNSGKQTNTGNCVLLNNVGITVLNNSHFISNFIMNSGNPCLDSRSYKNNLFIENVLFEKNQANIGCSCLHFTGNQLNITNSSFLENQAIKFDLGGSLIYFLGSEGGSLNLGAKIINLKNILIFNSSALKGAGIFYQNKNSKSFQTLYAFGLNVFNNHGVQSSAIEFDTTLFLGEAYFINCSFKANLVEFYGALSTFYYTTFNLFFLNNNISLNYGTIAGAAFSFCHFGGKVFINQTVLLGNVLDKSTFIGGAAIFVYGFCTTTLIFIKDCNFEENKSSFKGGAIEVAYGQLYMKDSIFKNNFAQIGGGAISVGVFSLGFLDNLLIKNKYKINQGGGIFCENFASIK